MGRIMACGASHNLQQGYPADERGESALEGIEAHDWARKILQRTATCDDVFDKDMGRYVNQYVNLCKSYIDGYNLYGVEEKMNDGHVSGTVDFFAWTPYELVIIDLKYGYGWVEVEENWQLIAYAILVWLNHGNGGKIIPPKVRLIICQPRANHPDGPVREWTFNGELLRGYYNQIQNQVGLVEQGVAPAVPGKQCKYCRAIIDCIANREYTSHLVDIAYAPEKINMTPQQLATDMDTMEQAVSMLNNRLVALSTVIDQNIKSGVLIPGYILKQNMTSLKWTVPDPITAAKEMGIDVAKPPEPITPTQAVNRGLIDKETIKFMASKSLGKFKLEKQNMAEILKMINN